MGRVLQISPELYKSNPGFLEIVIAVEETIKYPKINLEKSFQCKNMYKILGNS
jgi:hypothetical protein